MRKHGNILTENLIFIILNLFFLIILALLLYQKAGDPAILEEKYAKEIALMLDAARPGMFISIDMQDAVDMAKKEKWQRENIISQQENLITVKLSKNSGYSYSFFNNVNTIIDVFPNGRVEIKVVNKNG
jgi:hypothetical protein